VTVYNKNLSSQCKLPSQIEQVEDNNHLGSGLCVFISTIHNISVLFKWALSERKLDENLGIYLLWPYLVLLVLFKYFKCHSIFLFNEKQPINDND